MEEDPFHSAVSERILSRFPYKASWSCSVCSWPPSSEEKNSVSLKKPRVTSRASLLQILRGMLGFQSWDFTSKALSGVTLPWSALH